MPRPGLFELLSAAWAGRAAGKGAPHKAAVLVSRESMPCCRLGHGLLVKQQSNTTTPQEHYSNRTGSKRQRHRSSNSVPPHIPPLDAPLVSSAGAAMPCAVGHKQHGGGQVLQAHQHQPQGGRACRCHGRGAAIGTQDDEQGVKTASRQTGCAAGRSRRITGLLKAPPQAGRALSASWPPVTHAALRPLQRM